MAREWTDEASPVPGGPSRYPQSTADEMRAALIECAVLSGEDMDGDNTRAPDWPAVHVWAVRCVRELRDAYDEALHERLLPVSDAKVSGEDTGDE